MPLPWNMEISSGVPAMDRLHQQFLSNLNSLKTATDAEFSNRYDAFVANVERAFREEEEWMEEIDFSTLHVHAEQHARVLGALHHVQSCVMSGDIRLGRDLAERLLPQWFAFHVSTLDTTLALEMQLSQNERGNLFKRKPVQDLASETC